MPLVTTDVQLTEVSAGTQERSMELGWVCWVEPTVLQPSQATCLLTQTSGVIFLEQALSYWAVMNSISVWQDVVFQHCKCSQEDMEKLFLKKSFLFFLWKSTST